MMNIWEVQGNWSHEAGDEIQYIPVCVIYDLMIDVLEGLGPPAKDLRRIESHGVDRLKCYYDRMRAGVQFTKTEMESKPPL